MSTKSEKDRRAKPGERFMMPPGDLIPYARNAKPHDEANIALIAGSIRQFGFRNPVLIDGDNGIIAGHGRVLAALKLGLQEVPCIDCSDMSEREEDGAAFNDLEPAKAA